MLLLQLDNFLFELSTSQRAQSSGHMFCQELQLRNNTTGKSLESRKKKTQQTKPKAFADLTTTAISASASQLEPVRDAQLKSLLESCAKLGGAEGTSLCQVRSHLGTDLPIIDKVCLKV